MKSKFILVWNTILLILIGVLMANSSITTTPFVRSKSNPFTEEKLVLYLKELNIKYPYIALAQAKLETGNYTSKIFKNNNNLFGMKQARSRATTAKGTILNHAVYSSWEESVIDYALYSASYMSKIKSEKEYLAHLGRSYAQDPKYMIKLKAVIKKEKLKTLFR